MEILTIISRLIDYPTQELVAASEDVVQAIANDNHLTASDKHKLIKFFDDRCAMDILDWQSDYDALFERGRSLSLLLFEHVHGESRDRGQAMIDLIAQYKDAGLEIGLRELPDYIPLFLEFLSTQGMENAQAWLQDVAHILAVLKVRLAQRDSDYEDLFEALVNLSGAKVDYDDLWDQVKGEKRDDTKEAIDKVWEEEMVKFGPDSSNDACGSATNRPSQSQRRDQQVPIQMMDAVVAETLAKDAMQTSTVSGGH
ncbi:nitrate reductase molybdenum cofactor assembly chaperone [Colwellia sp. MEBiC06753]